MAALLALALLGLALALTTSWLMLPCPHFWVARELHVLRMGANASSAALVRPTLLPRSLGSLLAGIGAPATDAYTADGHRLKCASEAAANATVYLADAGRPWQWAAEWPGHERQLLLPGDEGELTLATLGLEPALFRVRGLLSLTLTLALALALTLTLTLTRCVGC